MPTPLDLDDIEGTICTGIDTDDRQTMTENHEAHAGLDVLIARVRQLEDECDRLRATGAEHQRAIVELAEEYNRRDAVTAELRATLANERGEGEGPSEGWAVVARRGPRAGRWCDVSPVTLPGDLVSPVAGALLRRGCPVVEVVTGDTATVVWIAPQPNAKGAYKAQTYTVEEDGECGTSAAASHFALDLTDPAGMDRAARWLAAHHGLTVGATAPGWNRTPTGKGVDEDMGGWWNMWTSRGIVFADFQKIELGGAKANIVTGISALTDPAPAMALACLAAGGRSA